jgi:hypothetical protein
VCTVAVASTGIAALPVEGQAVHPYFRLPHRVLTPGKLQLGDVFGTGTSAIGHTRASGRRAASPRGPDTDQVEPPRSYRTPPTPLEEITTGRRSGLLAEVLMACGVDVPKGAIEVFPQATQSPIRPLSGPKDRQLYARAIRDPLGSLG